MYPAIGSVSHTYMIHEMLRRQDNTITTERQSNTTQLAQSSYNINCLGWDLKPCHDHLLSRQRSVHVMYMYIHSLIHLECNGEFNYAVSSPFLWYVHVMRD